jgi:hypothetical protein
MANGDYLVEFAEILSLSGHAHVLSDVLSVRQSPVPRIRGAWSSSCFPTRTTSISTAPLRRSRSLEPGATSAKVVLAWKIL